MRVDGSSYETALDYLKPQIEYSHRGENLLALPETFSASDNRDSLNITKSPEKLAEECYNIWWNSPSHRDNMMSGYYDYLSVKIQSALKNSNEIYTVATTLFRSEFNNGNRFLEQDNYRNYNESGYRELSLFE